MHLEGLLQVTWMRQQDRVFSTGLLWNLFPPVLEGKAVPV